MLNFFKLNPRFTSILHVSHKGQRRYVHIGAEDSWSRSTIRQLKNCMGELLEVDPHAPLADRKRHDLVSFQ